MTALAQAVRGDGRVRVAPVRRAEPQAQATGSCPCERRGAFVSRQAHARASPLALQEVLRKRSEACQEARDRALPCHRLQEQREAGLSPGAPVADGFSVPEPGKGSDSPAAAGPGGLASTVGLSDHASVTTQAARGAAKGGTAYQAQARPPSPQTRGAEPTTQNAQEVGFSSARSLPASDRAERALESGLRLETAGRRADHAHQGFTSSTSR